MNFQPLGSFAPASNPLAIQQQGQAQQGFQPAQARPVGLDQGLLDQGTAGGVGHARAAAPAPVAPMSGGTPAGGAPQDMVHHYLDMLQKLHFGGSPATTASPGILPTSDAASSAVGVLG